MDSKSITRTKIEWSLLLHRGKHVSTYLDMVWYGATNEVSVASDIVARHFSSSPFFLPISATFVSSHPLHFVPVIYISLPLPLSLPLTLYL